MVKSRAQVITQALLFVLAGFVFVLIISYGYKAVSQMTARSEEVQLADAKGVLLSSAEIMKRSYKSVRRVDVRLPSIFDGLCVVDVENCPVSSPVLSFDSSVMRLDWIPDACRAGGANIFLVPRFDVSVPDLSVDGGSVCVPSVGGVVSLRMEGAGKKVKVSAW